MAFKNEIIINTIDYPYSDNIDNKNNKSDYIYEELISEMYCKTDFLRNVKIKYIKVLESFDLMVDGKMVQC